MLDEGMIMYMLFICIFFMFGTILGSFGNVVVYRIRSGSTLGGRSRCLSCGKTLSARMLVPVLSYIFQRGRCAHCGSRISLQYPLVEMIAGLLSVMAYVTSGLDIVDPDPYRAGIFILDLAFFETLLLIAVYDLKHKIIPDALAGILAFLGLSRALIVLLFFPHPISVGEVIVPAFDYFTVISLYWSPWLNILGGILLPLPFAALWYVSGGRWVGLGDAKISVGLGFAFGLGYGLTGIVLGFWIGAIVSAILLCMAWLSQKGKGITMKSELPFAPFLALGAVVSYLFDLNIANWTF